MVPNNYIENRKCIHEISCLINYTTSSKVAVPSSISTATLQTEIQNRTSIMVVKITNICTHAHFLAFHYITYSSKPSLYSFDPLTPIWYCFFLFFPFSFSRGDMILSWVHFSLPLLVTYSPARWKNKISSSTK